MGRVITNGTLSHCEVTATGFFNRIEISCTTAREDTVYSTVNHQTDESLLVDSWTG